MAKCKCGREVNKGFRLCVDCKWEVLDRPHKDDWYIQALDKINAMTTKQLRDFVRKR